MGIKAFSFGGGVQSHAVLALTAAGELDYEVFLFANVGDDSENPATTRYIREVTIPYCESHGIRFEEIRRIRGTGNARFGLHKGDAETLYEQITREGTRSIQIPVRMANGAPGNRNCTQTFKIEVIDRWLLARGASADDPARVGVGISLDEIDRMRTDQPNPTQRREYPLITARITRQRCREINEAAGFHDVPRSACWFCPMKKIGEWIDQARNEPGLFARSVGLETLLNRKRAAMGRDRVYMNSRRIPLPMLAQMEIPEYEFAESCDSGHCMT